MKTIDDVNFDDLKRWMLAEFNEHQRHSWLDIMSGVKEYLGMHDFDVEDIHPPVYGILHDVGFIKEAEDDDLNLYVRLEDD